MSFFFENQNKKVEIPKKRMMDVRVPTKNAITNKRGASHFSFTKGIPHSTSRKGMDGVKGFIPEHQNFTTPYAQRLQEMQGLKSVKQIKPGKHISFSLPFSFLKNTVCLPGVWSDLSAVYLPFFLFKILLKTVILKRSEEPRTKWTRRTAAIFTVCDSSLRFRMTA